MRTPPKAVRWAANCDCQAAMRQLRRSPDGAIALGGKACADLVALYRSSVNQCGEIMAQMRRQFGGRCFRPWSLDFRSRHSWFLPWVNAGEGWSRCRSPRFGRAFRRASCIRLSWELCPFGPGACTENLRLSETIRSLVTRAPVSSWVFSCLSQSRHGPAIPDFRM
jgi:hypothetical protein